MVTSFLSGIRSAWSTPVDGSTTTTSTTITVSDANFTESRTYTVYGGLYTTSGTETATANVDFTVATTSTATGNYYLEISIEDDDKYQSTNSEQKAGSYVYSSTDTVNVKVVLMDGDTDEEVTSFPSNYSVYVWFEDDAKAENELEYTTTDTTITDTITISNYTFTTGNNYNVYARMNYNDVEINGSMVSTSFTIETTYGIELSLNSVTTDYQEFSVGDVLSTAFTVTTNVNGGSSTESTATPTGTYVTIYYQDDTGWHDLVYRLGSSIYSNEYGSNPEDLTLSSGSFSEGNTYTVYIELYNEGGEKLAYDTIVFTIPVRASFYTRTLTLDGAVAVNYYVDMTGVSDPENYTVVFKLDEGNEYRTANYNSGSYRDDFNGDTKYYRFTFELDSTQMALTFDAVLTYNGTTAVQTDSGYSVEKYCKSAITGGWAEAGVCAALLNYGGYSQTYFSVNADSMANANLNSYDSTWSDPVSTWDEDVSEYEATVSNLPSEITGTAVSLVLESETVIRLYFNANDTSNLTFTVDDTELTIMNASSGSYSYYVEFSVQASRLKETFTVTVSNGSTKGTVEYSAYAYINTVVNDSTDTYTDAHKNVCKALYYYAEAADEYSNWYTGLT